MMAPLRCLPGRPADPPSTPQCAFSPRPSLSGAVA